MKRMRRGGGHRAVLIALGREASDGLTVHGHPIVSNRGRFDVGSDFVLVARPEPTHLVVQSAAQLIVGNRVRIAQGVALSCTDRIEIGDDTVIEAFVMLTDFDFHVAGDSSAHPSAKPITIGDRVRIGAHTVVMPGTSIGDDVTIAPASVVSGHVASGKTVGGNPAVERHHRLRQGRSVPELFASVFDLTTSPPLETRTEAIPGWDSLGALRLLIAFEADYDIKIDERLIAELVMVADWQDLVTDPQVER